MEQERVVFENWDRIWQTALIGLVAYGALVILLRAAGKRTLAKMNVFDLVGIVAMGSTLAGTMLSPDVALAEGITALTVIIVAQTVLAWITSRVPWAERTVNGRPTLLLHRGRVLEDVLKREHFTVEELRAAVRSKGVPTLEDVDAVVLESDGTISVLAPPRDGKDATSLSDVDGVNGRSA